MAQRAAGGEEESMPRSGAAVPKMSTFQGSFMEPGPWPVDPASMPWRVEVDDLRVASRGQVSRLVTPPAIPPLRMLHVGTSLGLAIVPAVLRKRRGDGTGAEQAAAAARGLRRAFERLGVTFIKLGQLTAGCEGLLPDEVVHEFAACRDQVRPESFRHVRKLVESELGTRLETIFAEFEEAPLAAASIAQVHAARLCSGEEVVVKVQRPGLARVISADVASMAWLLRLLESRAPQAKALNIGAYLELLAETLMEELDFRLEAQNMLDLAEVLVGSAEHRVVVPRPHPELVTSRVLVMERLHGVKIDAASDLKLLGADAGGILASLLLSFFEGSLVHGVFHGDMHGGNMMVTSEGVPALLDMGVTGRFAPEARTALASLIMTPNGTRAKLEAFQRLGGFPSDVDLDEIEARLADLEAGREHGTDEDMGTANRDFLAQAVKLGARIPKELFLFVRGVLYLNGALAALGSDVDLAGAFGQVTTHLADRHGTQLAEETGVDPEHMRQSAANSRRQMREELGLDETAERITFQDVKAARARGTA